MRTENRQRTHGEQTENLKPEATLVRVDIRGERANFVRTENKQRTNRQTENSKPEATLIPVDRGDEQVN